MSPNLRVKTPLYMYEQSAQTKHGTKGKLNVHDIPLHTKGLLDPQLALLIPLEVYP